MSDVAKHKVVQMEMSSRLHIRLLFPDIDSCLHLRRECGASIELPVISASVYRLHLLAEENPFLTSDLIGFWAL